MSQLLQRIAHWLQRRTAAPEVEVRLDPPQQESSRETQPLHESAGDSPRAERDHSGNRVVLPIRHRGRRIGIVRLRASGAGDWQNLQPTLDRVGPALARAREMQNIHVQAHRYAALLANLPDWNVLVLDHDGCVREIHGGQLLDGVRSQWLGKPLQGHSQAPACLDLPRSRIRQLVGSTLRSGRAELETRLRLPNGLRDIHLTLIRMGPSDEILGVIRDLSAVRAMEKALLRRNQELSEAAERLKEIDMLKNEFLSNVSHELRTPLTAIIAYTEALLMTRPEEATREQFLRVIAEQGDKLQRLIAGLLDIAKLDSLATELKLQPASLNHVIEAAIVTVQPIADKNQIRLRADLDPALPLVFLDELRSQQIVWNLLTNAIKFSPPESEVRVRSWLEGGHVWVGVSDQGMGIAPEHQELIFQKFVQVDGSSTRRHGGVGLGLDLVKHLVELHGGQVRVESTVGHGATFAFSIPVEKRRRPRSHTSPHPSGSAHSR
jgi:signal transduction histidine kinase